MERQPVVFDKFKSIDTLIFDVDGVWTNGDLLITEDGGLLRTMNTKDGYAGVKAVKAGYQLIVISGGTSKGVEDRLRKLGMSEVHIGVQDKMALFNDMVAAGKINPGTSLFVGDDLPDFDVLKAVYLSCCPADAVPELLDECEYISPYEGGKGCVRDIIERVMRSQDKW
ncbi:KdsC family phosphatase [Portibacter lacus]|uniref:3-deoxy-D-manno-octulosonate 8-phosphate phosphatase KdsC n=1 Tax=Portibacter lacus TaxID=1099794 RepID=A0AA37WDT9_9BACT|nr:3-deoxy-D-manno-octulosonate 8-phosphate phosphatase [Portibacter lacus]GLR15495.1 3-deoxy-D-manno-octulosonate 8-phosphate phosphatase [Portibacter lacus]